MTDGKEEYVMVKLSYRNGEIEDYDSSIMKREEAYKYGGDMAKNHAHIVDGYYALCQDEEWKEEYGFVEYVYDDWLEVEWGGGMARVRSIEPISAEEVEVLRKWGF